MKSYKDLLICLDLTDMDQVVLRYAHYLSQVLPKVGQVYFLHNIRFDYPKEAEGLLEALHRPLPELIGEEITERVEQHFERAGEAVPKWEVVVTQGRSTAQEIAHFCTQREVQLALVGKKRSYPGSGLLAERLLRQSAFKADLMVLPETAPHRLSRILVPIDFSASAARALRGAARLAEDTGSELACQHVYKIPAHYFPFIPVQGFRESMGKEAEAKYRKFQRELPDELQAVPCEFTYSKDRTTAQAVYDFAINKNKDLIALGAKGRSAIPAILLGSTAIQLLKFDFHIPLVVIR